MIGDPVAIVTGAGRGIGRAVARALAEEGYRVVLAARTGPQLDEVAREIEADGGEAISVPADVTDAGAVDAVVARALEWSGGRIDVLVNNAGGSRAMNVADAPLEHFDQTLAVNLRSTILCTRAVLPHILRRGEGGAIVNIASIAGRRGQPGISAYSAAKHGVIGFTESLFEEVREQGIKVSVIEPGFVDTSLLGPDAPLDRTKMISPEEVAEAVIFVVRSGPRVCPTEIVLRPQRTPYLR